MSIEDDIFEENYKNTLYKLETLSRQPNFDLDELQRELDTLCTFEGQDWIGRGEMKQSEISGTISAYQVFMFRYKNNRYDWLSPEK